MFYLIKRVDEKKCKVGDRCMLLADFYGVSPGTLGTVSEVHKPEEEIIVKWDQSPKASLSDTFSRKYIEWLAFATVRRV